MLFKNSGLVNEEVAGMVDDCLNHTPLGEDDVTDYLAVTLYAGNYDNLPISEALLKCRTRMPGSTAPLNTS